jgi:hypothetical protein
MELILGATSRISDVISEILLKKVTGKSMDTLSCSDGMMSAGRH